MTREELAVLLSYLIGQDELELTTEEKSDLLKLEDAALIKETDAAALSLKLGLLTAADGKFRPQVAVSLADAAVVLSRLAQMQANLAYPLDESEFVRYQNGL